MSLKPPFLLVFPLLICRFVISPAQNPGCDGTRYKQPVFANVQKTSLTYATAISQIGQTVTLVMDVYEPQGDTTSQRPVVVLAHGGSFIFGDKTDMTRWCQLLAQRGYVAASIQYRLYPVFVLGYPDSVAIMDAAFKAVGDMKAAVRYFREDAATANKFRADVQHIFIGGYSAGAVAALHAAYLDSTDVVPGFIQNIVNANGGLNGNAGSASNQSYSSAASAVISMSGGLYRREWIGDGDMPMASIHGTADGTVPFLSGLAANIAYLEGSGLLHQRAQQVGAWSYLKKIPGGGHTDIYDQVKYAPQVDNFWMRATALLEFMTCYVDNSPHLVSGSGDVPAPLPASDWFITPNPVRENQFAIQFPDSTSSVNIAVLDATGHNVFQVNSVHDGQVLTLPAGLPRGVYFVQISNTGQPDKGVQTKQLLLLP